MIMTTQQLQYLLEIERVRSISQAAANLYMGQPNLSRLLREMETASGFPIFERTRKGVRPTEKGQQFLQHARNILREAEFMEQLGPNGTKPNRFRICLPRSYEYVDRTQRYLCKRMAGNGIDGYIQECHPRQAVEMLDNGLVEIAIIRYGVEYQDYFSEQAQARELSLQRLSQTEYRILVDKKNSLSKRPTLSADDLDGFVEIFHRDTFYSAVSEKRDLNQIYTVDRMAQWQLLKKIPNSYMWSEPMSQEALNLMQLSMHSYQSGGNIYQNALLYKPRCAMSDVEKDFLHWIIEKDTCKR